MSTGYGCSCGSVSVGWGRLVSRYAGPCTWSLPSCTWFCSPPATSAAVSATAWRGIVLAAGVRSELHCSGHVVASGLCQMERHTAVRCNSQSVTVWDYMPTSAPALVSADVWCGRSPVRGSCRISLPLWHASQTSLAGPPSSLQKLGGWCRRRSQTRRLNIVYWWCVGHVKLYYFILLRTMAACSSHKQFVKKRNTS